MTKTGFDNNPSISVKVKTPRNGTAVIFITYKKKSKKIIHISCFIGKAGTDVSSWAIGLSRMTVVALRHSTLDEVIEELNEIATDRAVQTQGTTCRSGPEALAIALRIFQIKVLSN